MYSVTLVAVCCLLTLGSCKPKVDAAEEEDQPGSICKEGICLNGGSCTEDTDNLGKPFKCKCMDGYEGDLCQIEKGRNTGDLDDKEKEAERPKEPEFADDPEDEIPKKDPMPAEAKAEEAAVDEAGYVVGPWSSKPYNPFLKYVHPCECNDQCCIGTNLQLDFTRYKRGTVNNLQGLVQMIQYPEYHYSEFHNYWWLDCFYPALLKINVNKITNYPLPDYYGLCQDSPGCRRMIRIDMYFSNPYHWTGGHRMMFHFGDSEYNYPGWGDYYDRHHWDANIFGNRNRVRFYGHEHCKRYYPWVLDDVLNSKVEHLTAWISHNHLRVKNYVGFDERFCTSCGFKLNGEYDYKYSYGCYQDNSNQDIYIAFNRMIHTPNYYYHQYKHGAGVCRATVRYECGWNPDCCDNNQGIYHGYGGYGQAYKAEEAGKAEKSEAGAEPVMAKSEE